MYFNREPKPKENTGSPTSQDDFTKRSYFYGDQDHRLQNQTPSFIRNESSIDDESTRTSSRKRCSKTAWIWGWSHYVYIPKTGKFVWRIC